MGTGTGDDEVDVVITEVGGTVGDIESLPFLEAARQVRHDIGRDNCFFLHVSLVPYIGPSGELKTKPTQHSVAALRQVGIQPDAVVCRADRELPDSIKRKISLMCDVDQEAVVTRRRRAVDLRHPEGAAPRGPRRLRRTPPRPAVPRRRLDRLGRPAAPGAPPDRGGHGRPRRQVRRPPRRLPVRRRGAAGRRVRPRRAGRPPLGPLRRVRDPGRRRQAPAATSTRCACPGGFGVRGIEGKLGALTYARTHGIPTLGLCLGLQCMVIEYARCVAGLEKAGLHRVRPRLPRAGDRHHGGAEVASSTARATSAARCGSASTRPSCRGLAGRARPTAQATIEERHRHRYEVNNAYRDQLAEAGLVFSGTNPDLDLVEFVELPRDVHPYYVATQAHPELRSRPTRPHPLFAGPDRRRARAAARAAVPDRRDRAAPRARGRRRDRAELADRPEDWPVVESRDLHRGDWVVALRSRPDPAPRTSPRRRAVQADRRRAPRRGRGAGHRRRGPGGLPVGSTATPRRQRFIELPAGMSTAGEDPLEVGRRELREEAGAGGGGVDPPALGVLLARHTRPRSSTTTSPATCARSVAATSCWRTRRPTWSSFRVPFADLLDAVLAGPSETRPWR